MTQEEPNKAYTTNMEGKSKIKPDAMGFVVPINLNACILAGGAQKRCHMASKRIRHWYNITPSVRRQLFVSKFGVTACK